jgi:CRISPR/Cas system-associated exonuclease Cas4 (RecB family)
MFDDLLGWMNTAASSRKTVFVTDEGKVHDRSSTVGASEVFSCIKQLSYHKHKTPEDPDFVQGWGFLERGNTMEDWTVALVKEALGGKGVLTDAGKGQATIQWQYLSATPDGFIFFYDIENNRVEVIFEIKSIDPRYQSELPKPAHKMQVQVQMGLANHQLGKSIDEAWIIYVEASNYSKMTLHRVERDQAVFTHALNRARDAFEKKPEDLPTEGKLSGCCKWCPYAQRCGQHISDSMPTKTGLSNHQADFINPLIKSKLTLDKEIKAKKREQGEIIEDIKAYMRTEGIKSGASDDYLITYHEVAGRRSLDKDLVSDKGIDLSDCYSIGKPSDQLKIKEIK